MSFFQGPIIKGEWHTNIDTFVFKAFQKNDKEVEIKIYKKRTFLDDEVANITMNNNGFYNNFVRILNTDEPMILEGKEKHGEWTCDKADKERVLASMPKNSEMAEFKSEGGNKRSGKKRKSQTKCKSHKRSHKRSGHKKSRRH